MAKVKLKFGDNEIEIESRDFYVDNQTIGDVIENIANHLQENSGKIVYEEKTESKQTDESVSPNYESLDSLDNAEFYEPEFNEPKSLSSQELKYKLHLLEKNSFFDTPKNISEIVDELREYGWMAHPLDVSKIMTQMSLNREIEKSIQESRSYFFVKEPVVS